MSNLRKKLKAAAARDLEDCIDSVRRSAVIVANDAGIEANDLLRLALGGRVAALESKVLSQMVNLVEARLLAGLEDDEPVTVTGPEVIEGKGNGQTVAETPDQIRELAISAKADEIENLPEPLKSHVIAEQKKMRENEELPIG